MEKDRFGFSMPRNCLWQAHKSFDYAKYEGPSALSSPKAAEIWTDPPAEFTAFDLFQSCVLIDDLKKFGYNIFRFIRGGKCCAKYKIQHGSAQQL